MEEEQSATQHKEWLSAYLIPARGLKRYEMQWQQDGACYQAFRLLNPRKGTETSSESWYLSRWRWTFRLLNPRKGTETAKRQ